MEPLQHILLVEDDEDIAELIILALTELGQLKVIHCNSGEAALKIVQESRPQLILMDVMMPNMDGPTAMKEIRKLSGFIHIPIVLITARVQPHELHEYYEMGAIDVITKPFDPVRLSELLTNSWKLSHESNKDKK